MWALKSTVGKKYTWNMEQTCKRNEWLTNLPITHDGTDLSREEFRDAYVDTFIYSSKIHPLTCDGCSDPFTMDHEFGFKKRGL